MANAQRLPSGAWRTQATKTINGKQVRKSFSVTPEDSSKEASKKAKAQSELMAREWLFKKEEDKPNVLTVDQAIDRYNENRSEVLSASTIADYLRMKKYFEPILNVNVNDVTTDMLQRLINDMAMQTNRYGKRINDRTIKNRIFYLLAVFGYCELNKNFKLRFPVPEEEKDYNPPEKSEFNRLLDNLETQEDRLIIMLAGLYTLRRGEICGLRGQDILWDMHSIRVSHSRVLDKDKEWVLRPPKTKKSVRTIEIDPELMTLFPNDIGPNELVIKRNPNECTKFFERLRKKACVKCRLHDLRKYAASIRSDIMPTKYVEAAGGWKKGSKVLTTIYDKPFKESNHEYSKKFNQMAMENYGNKLLG